MEVSATEILARAEQLPAVATLLERIGTGFEPPVWLVGGSLRDLLLGAVPTDIDLMVDGDPAPVAVALGSELVRHDAYLTASVGGYDLARPRRETYPGRRGRRPRGSHAARLQRQRHGARPHRP